MTLLSFTLAVDKPTADLLTPFNELTVPDNAASAGKPSEFSAPRRDAVVKAISQASAAAKTATSTNTQGSSVVRSNTVDASSKILRFEQASSPDGSYQYAFETDNGIDVQEKGEPKIVDDVQTLNVQGGYSYVAPDGTVISMQYIANENGFQPTVLFPKN